MRTVTRVLAGLIMTGMAAAPALAQTSASAQSDAKADISAGYNFFRDVTGKTNVPKGFFVDVNSAGRAGVATEISGNFKDGTSAWNLLGGGQVCRADKTADLCGRVLVGWTRASDSLASTNGFTIQPGATVNIFGGHRAGARALVGFDLTHVSGAWDKGVNVGLGIVFGAGK